MAPAASVLDITTNFTLQIGPKYASWVCIVGNWLSIAKVTEPLLPNTQERLLLPHLWGKSHRGLHGSHSLPSLHSCFVLLAPPVLPPVVSRQMDGTISSPKRIGPYLGIASCEYRWAVTSSLLKDVHVETKTHREHQVTLKAADASNRQGFSTPVSQRTEPADTLPSASGFQNCETGSPPWYFKPLLFVVLWFGSHRKVIPHEYPWMSSRVDENNFQIFNWFIYLKERQTEIFYPVTYSPKSLE